MDIINTVDYGTIKITKDYLYGDDQYRDVVETCDGSYYQVYYHNGKYYAYKIVS